MIVHIANSPVVLCCKPSAFNRMGHIALHCRYMNERDNEKLHSVKVNRGRRRPPAYWSITTHCSPDPAQPAVQRGYRSMSSPCDSATQ